VTFIASRLASEQVVALVLLQRKLRLLGEHSIKFRSERSHFGRRFMAGDRLRHLVEGRADTAAIDRAQVDRQRIGRGRRPRLVADLLDVARPCDRKTLRPHTPSNRTR
jgi:hypothetical protein